MSDTQRFRPGDKVRVTYEATFEEKDVFDEGDMRVRDLDQAMKTSRVPPNATVELIQRADDPSKDPVGTVRQESIAPPVVKIGPDHWVTVWPGRWSNSVEVFSNDDMTGYKVIGAVPGTPAAEKQAADELSRQQGDEEWRPRAFIDAEGDRWTEVEPDRFFVGSLEVAMQKLADYRERGGQSLAHLQENEGPVREVPVK